MGLFDFIFHTGEKFTKDEINILDLNFNSISAYTKKKYKFARKRLRSNLSGHASMGVNFHNITYEHTDINTDEWDPEWTVSINCDRYYLRDNNDYRAFKNHYEETLHTPTGDFPIIKVPEISNFPTPVLTVGYRGNGFAVELKYNYESSIDKTLENSDLTDDCIKKIELLSIKYLTNLK